MAHNRVGDAANQCPSHTAQAPAPHHYEPGTQLLGQVDDGLIAAFSDPEPEVGFFDAASRLSDLSNLLVEHLLGFCPYRFERLLVGFVAQAAFVYVVNGIEIPGRYAEEVNSEFVELARSVAVLAASCAS